MNAKATAPYRKTENRDALDAYRTFRWARNWFFWLAFLSLILILTIFTAVTVGLMDPPAATSQDSASVATADPSSAGQPTTDDATDAATDTQPPVIQPDATPADEDPKILLGLTLDQLKKICRTTMAVCNNLICFCVSLYMVTLLVGINLAIVGRLGGLAPLTRGFIYALVLMALLLPWPALQQADVPGLLYSYDELTQAYITYPGPANFFSAPVIGYFLRFALLPAIVALLLLLSFGLTVSAWKSVKRRSQARQDQSLSSLDNTSTPAGESPTGTIPLS